MDISNYKMYYLVATTSTCDENLPVFLWIINGGHMFQFGTTDATKFTSEELAQKRIELLNSINPDTTYSIVPVGAGLFGGYLKNVMDYEAGYIDSDEVRTYGKFTKREVEYIKRQYSNYPKGHFSTPLEVSFEGLTKEIEKGKLYGIYQEDEEEV